MEGDAERLEHGHGGVVEAVRHRVQEPGRPGDVLPQASVGGAVTSETDLGAQVGVAFPAPLAGVVGDSRVDGDAPAIEGAAFYRPPNSWPKTSGRLSSASPMPPSPNQWRSEPHRPTSPTRTRLSPGPAFGAGLIDDSDNARAAQPGCFHRSTPIPVQFWP